MCIATNTGKHIKSKASKMRDISAMSADMALEQNPFALKWAIFAKSAQDNDKWLESNQLDFVSLDFTKNMKSGFDDEDDGGEWSDDEQWSEDDFDDDDIGGYEQYDDDDYQNPDSEYEE